MTNEKNIMIASTRNLRLVENGIFPIKYDSKGNLIDNELDTGLDIPGTIQGEGKLLGTPCLFIRTSQCNLSCSWVGSDGNGSTCDTPYSSHFPENNKMSIDEILLIIKNNLGNLEHIVISGGEPMLQGRRLYDLLVELKMTHNLHITIETNGTIYIPEIAAMTNLISISPKLASSTPWSANLKNTSIAFNENVAKTHEKRRINLAVLQRWIDWKHENPVERDFQFKFVISENYELDIKEIDYILSQLTGWKKSDICLMPEGVNSADLMKKTEWLTKVCIEKGWRFTPRLHALLWGVKRSV